MRMIFRISLSALAVFCVFVSCVHAAGARQQYDQVIKGRQAVGTLGPVWFDDDVNVASEALSFTGVGAGIAANSAPEDKR